MTEADGGLVLTYAQAARRVRRWAAGISAQTEPGDVVVVATPNGYEQLLLCCAAARAGRIPAPVNSQMRKDEVAHVVSDSGATLVLKSAVSVDNADSTADAHKAAPDDVAALFYTSGTTGKPKGAALTHKALVGQVAERGAVADAAPPRRGRHRAAGGPHHGLRHPDRPRGGRHPRVPAAEVQPREGARRHRGAAGDDVHGRARHVPDARRGARRRARPHLGAGLGVGRRCHAGRAGRAVQEDGRHHHRPPARRHGRGDVRRGVRHGRGGRWGRRQGVAPVPLRRVRPAR